jgi:hypothetical protein
MVPAAMTTAGMSRPVRGATRRGVVGAALAVLLVASCSGAGSTPLPSPELSAAAASSPPASAAAPTSIPSPSATLIPGYEDWSVINPASVDITLQGQTLVMHLLGQALWFQDSRGVLFWSPIDGDFRVTATVHTARFSDPSKPPGQDGSVQLAGLMARLDTDAENYVFIVVGSDADGLSVETKSTANNVSEYEGPAWPSGDAELKLCRVGTTFTLAKRPVPAASATGQPAPWTVATTLHRPELAGEMQVGPNIYTNSTPDLVARFDDLVIEAIGPGDAC